MNLVRFNTDRSLANAREMDRLFDSFFTRSFLPANTPALTLAVDVEENPEEFIFRADLPGLDPKDVKVTLDGDTLTIRGERKRSTDSQQGRWHRIERSFGSFERAYTLHTPVRADRVSADYRNGVLEVHVPKADEAKARDIEVRVQ